MMTAPQTEELLNAELDLVIATAERYPTWRDYRRIRHDALCHMSPSQLCRIRELFLKHRTVEGYCRAVAAKLTQSEWNMVETRLRALSKYA